MRKNTKINRLVRLMEETKKPITTNQILKQYNSKYKWQYTKMELAQVLSKNKLFVRSKEIGYSPRNDSDGFRAVNTWILKKN